MYPPSTKDREEIALYFMGQKGAFSAYFKVYDDISKQDRDPVFPLSRHPSTELIHADILRVASDLKRDTSVTRSDLRESFQNGNRTLYSPNSIDKAVDMAIQAMIMVDSNATRWHSSGFTVGDSKPTLWSEKESFLAFVERSFAQSKIIPAETVKNAVEQKAAMKAWKLQSRLGLSFRATNNLADHLLHDPKRNCIYLFHHTSFLKAHLELFYTDPSALELRMAECLPRGSLPPQLLVETLHSLQSILFPSIDQVSSPILDDLINKHGFDSDCAHYEGYKLFCEVPEGFEYIYWGNRLAYIYCLLMARPPRNRMERWLQWQSNDGNALLVALLALLITIILGILGLLITAIQTWIAWQAWQHPISV